MPIRNPPARSAGELEEEADHQAPSTSDGEQIDYEESEAEEISHAEAAEDEVEEEAPPPIPSRATRLRSRGPRLRLAADTPLPASSASDFSQ